MKLIAALALLSLLAATAATSESECAQEMQRHSLERCRSFMRQGGRQSVILMESTGAAEDNDEWEAPEECCMQLRRVRRECRCPTIREMMQREMQEEGYRMGQECHGRCGEMMMRGRFLPAICRVEPYTCQMRSQGGGD